MTTDTERTTGGGGREAARGAPGVRWRVLLAAALALGGCARDGGAAEPVVGRPCEGCEIVFEGMPAAPRASARIAPEGEPGEPMAVEGTVRDGAGRPVPGIVVYAYQTDATGIYPRAATRHGRLRGWARTGPDGGYRFDTIRPGGYPGTGIPQHVHLHVPFVPFVAGAVSMTYPKFAFYNVTGAVLWVGVCVGGGYAFGNVPVVKQNFSMVVLGIIAVSLLPIAIEFIQARRRKAGLASRSLEAAD